MKDSSNFPAEERIKTTARELFLEKGFKNTTIREIAEKADVNLSMMNYYFRSKDKLFMSIAKESIEELTNKMAEVLDSELPFEEKIKKYIDVYTDHLIMEPELPLFMHTNMQSDLAKFSKISNLHRLYTSKKLDSQLIASIEEGKYRKIPIEQFYINLVSLTVFPFIAHSVIADAYHLSKEEFNQRMRERKTMVYDMVMSVLKK